MTLRYKDGTPLIYHLNTFQGIIKQFDRMDTKFDDEVHELCLLGTLLDFSETFKA